MAVNEHDGRPDAADARIARIYREAAREEPPPHLDLAIRGAAQMPLQTAEPPRRKWWVSWQLPFAVAAVGVLSVSLVVLMLEEGGERLTYVPPAAPAAEMEPDAAPTPTAPSTATSPAKEKRRDDARRAPAQRPADPAPRVEAPPAGIVQEPSAKTADEALAERQVRASDAAAARPGRQERPSEAGEAQAERSRAVEAPPAPFPEIAGAAPIEQSPGAAPSGERGAAAAPPPPAAKPAPRSAPKPAPAAKPAPAPAAKPAAPSRRFAREAAPAAQPAPDVALHISQLDGEPPSKWIERVLELRREGRSAEADAVLTEMKKRFPGIALPPELR